MRTIRQGGGIKHARRIAIVLEGSRGFRPFNYAINEEIHLSYGGGAYGGRCPGDVAREGGARSYVGRYGKVRIRALSIVGRLSVIGTLRIVCALAVGSSV